MNTILVNREYQSNAIVDIIKELHKNNLVEIDKISLANSICHMTMNRLFRSKPRLSEMVVYGLMSRYYKSLLAIEKKSFNSVKKQLPNTEVLA